MRKFLAICLAIMMTLALCPAVVAAEAAASPAVFAADRAPTRYEAVTMLVCLMGKEKEALNGTWKTPYTDLAEWARPYVGYAYANQLIPPTSETLFNGDQVMTTDQYLAIVLRALGYKNDMNLAGAGGSKTASAEKLSSAGGLAGILHSSLGLTLQRYQPDMTDYSVDLSGKIPEATGKRQLTDEGLKKLSGKSPEEAAASIKTLADAYAWLEQEGYKTHGMHISHGNFTNDIQRKQVSWIEMSTLLNVLLEGDYDEVGTLLFVTHPQEAGWDMFYISFNYVKTGGRYYVTDPLDQYENDGWAIYRAHTIEAGSLHAVRAAMGEYNDTSILITMASYPLYTDEIDVNFQKSPLSVTFPGLKDVTYLYRVDSETLTAYEQKQAEAKKAEAERWTKKASGLKVSDYGMPAAIGGTTLTYQTAYALVGEKPEKIAEKVRTVGDVLQYMIAARFGYDAPKAYTPWYDGWGFDAPGDEQLLQNFGCCCGGYANTVSYLLQGDYDKVGTLRWIGGGNHTISWVYTGGKYYVFDFTQYCAGGNYDNRHAPVVVLDNLKDYYKNLPDIYPKGEIEVMVAFETGEAMYPSHWNDSPRFTDLTFPTEAKGKVTVIYQKNAAYGVLYEDVKAEIPGW